MSSQGYYKLYTYCTWRRLGICAAGAALFGKVTIVVPCVYDEGETESQNKGLR